MAHNGDFQETTQIAENKLPASDATFLSSIGSLTVISGSASLSFTAEQQPYENDTTHSSLSITPGNTSDFTISCDTFTTELRDQLDDIVFHARILSPVACAVTIELTNNQGLATSTTRVATVPANRWTVIRSAGVDMPSSTTLFDIDINLTFSGHQSGSPIYMAYPTAMADFAFTDNEFVRECVPNIPEIMVSLDSQETFPSFPMLRMLEVGSGYAGLAYQQYKHYRYRDLAAGKNSNNTDTLSGLVDPDVAEADYLEWLSQFAGVSLDGTTSGTTPWENLVGAGGLTTWSQLMEQADDDGFDSINLIGITRKTDGYVSAVVASGDFTTANPQVGETIVVAGTSNFDGQFEITSVNAGSAEITYNDGVEWASLTRDSSGNVVGYIDPSSATHQLNPPDWAVVGGTIDIAGVTDTSFNGSFTITAINAPANTISWNDGTTTAATESTGFGSYFINESGVGTITQVDSSWLDLELYDLAASSLEEFYRSQIRNAYNGYKAGSLASLELATKEFLKDTKTVSITQHYQNDQWSILIETLTSETPEGVDDTASEVIENVIIKAKPAGYVVTHLCRATL